MKKVLVCCFLLLVTILLTIHPLYAVEYRKKISIDHTRVLDENQQNFTVLIDVTDPALKSTQNNGHVSQKDGSDIHFTLPDGKTEIDAELVSYDPATGKVKAWLRVPEISSSKDTDLYIRYGSSARKRKANVWDSSYVLVKHLDTAKNPDIQIPDKGKIAFTDQITIQAWAYGEQVGGEALQPLVSKWSPCTTLSQENFRAYDASKTDSLNTRGFFGAVFDGRYIYFAPQRETMIGKEAVHGFVLRYDTQKDFMDRSSWEAYDASHTDGLETRGHYGAVFDGRYVYIVPRGRVYDENIEHQTRILRYDTHGDFKDRASWSAYDFGLAHSHQSAGFDGRFIYFCPGFYLSDDKTKSVDSTIILRFDTQSGFKDRSSYTTFDVKEISDQGKGCYDGASFDGRYMYFVPLSSGIPLRYDTTKDFHNPKSWETFDGTSIGMKSASSVGAAFVGATFDGRYVYYDAYSHTNMVRYDTQGPFTDIRSWKNFEAGKTPGLKIGGYDGGFFDSRYVWFVPYQNSGVMHATWLRYDTQKPFDAQPSWDVFDAAATDVLQNGGYNAGAFDGRFFYTAPFRLPGNDYVEGSLNSGNVMRVDTHLGGTGSFSLRYCDYGHNGGLNAALRGPSFIINTVKGPVSISANKALVPGWHFISGVYNGKTIKIFVDGVLVNEQSGSGTIQKNAVDIEIGRIQKGSARFTGAIDEVRISNVARNDTWIKTEYQNMANPARFITITKEEEVK